MAVKARFFIAGFDKVVIGHKDEARTEPILQATVTMRAVTRKDTEDNVDWAKYTPSGEIKMVVSQQAGGAYDEFERLQGRDMSVTFEEIVRAE